MLRLKFTIPMSSGIGQNSRYQTDLQHFLWSKWKKTDLDLKMFNIKEDENLTRNRQVGQQVANRHLPGLYIPSFTQVDLYDDK